MKERPTSAGSTRTKSGESAKAVAVPRATVISREWWSTTTRDHAAERAPIVRLQQIVLLDPAHGGFRTAWYSDRDYAAATGDYRLVVLNADRSKNEIVLKLKHQKLGHDLEGYRAALHEAIATEGFVPEDQIPVTVELADRRFTISYADWRNGRLSADDSSSLAVFRSEPLKSALESIRSMSHAFPDLMEPCIFIVCPVLGDKECPFEDSPSLITPRGRPDCDFDGSFGEFCSIEQLMDFKLRTQPQVAPPR